MTTLAAGTAAPVESVTVPVIPPSDCCALAGKTPNADTKRKAASRKRMTTSSGSKSILTHECEPWEPQKGYKMVNMEGLAQNLTTVRERIARAAERAGRD